MNFKKKKWGDRGSYTLCGLHSLSVIDPGNLWEGQSGLEGVPGRLLGATYVPFLRLGAGYMRGFTLLKYIKLYS